MALISCPQCNQTISDKSKKCINCGYKIKKPLMHRRLIVTFIGVFCAFSILSFIITFITSQVSINQYFSLVFEKNISCIFGNHHWKNATCYTPKHCSICNSKKGETLEHQWKESDCINAKMCLLCKETEGDPLGHTVNIGDCTRCNEYVNIYEVEFTVIKESLSCLKKNFENIVDYFGISSSVYVELYYCNLAKNEALNIKETACIARDMCGDIPEFSEMKKCFARIDTALGEQIDVELTVNNYFSYASMLSKKVKNSAMAFNETVAEINKILEG